MIFHLSFNFNELDEGKSLNACMPRELCMVKYNDLDTAVRECLRLLQEADVLDDPELKGLIEKGERLILYLGKTDLSSTFRVLPLKVCCFCWLVFKVVDLTTGETMYFVD